MGWGGRGRRRPASVIQGAGPPQTPKDLEPASLWNCDEEMSAVGAAHRDEDRAFSLQPGWWGTEAFGGVSASHPVPGGRCRAATQPQNAWGPRPVLANCPVTNVGEDSSWGALQDSNTQDARSLTAAARCANTRLLQETLKHSADSSATAPLCPGQPPLPSTH